MAINGLSHMEQQQSDNKTTIGSFFPYKDKLRLELRSSLVYQYTGINILRHNIRISIYIRTWYTYINIYTYVIYVYQYSCRTCSCRCIGSTYRSLYIRVHSNWGKNDQLSSILDNSIICSTKIDNSKYKVPDQINRKFSLRILESLYIHKKA